MSGNWSERRVVITGMGAVTPLGNSLEEMWPKLIAGQCGVDRIRSFDPSPFATHIAAEVKNFIPAGFPSPKDVRRADRYSQFAITAGHQALLDSGLDLNRENLDEIGVFIGSGIGGL
jgi:3-oxoacyl-[acyl-carrier-protein] synthase II